MLVLASASPRRAELLRQIGMTFDVQAVDIDERQLGVESPNSYVLRLAKEKAQAAFEQLGRGPVLGSDTAVVLGDQVFGKPVDYDDFASMMIQLSGKAHVVMSSVAVVDTNRVETAVSVTGVRLRELSQAEIQNYWHTGEPKGKAGGYAIQGMAASFIERIEGSYSGVMGLPLYETSKLLRTFGLLPLDQIWSKR